MSCLDSEPALFPVRLDNRYAERNGNVAQHMAAGEKPEELRQCGPIHTTKLPDLIPTSVFVVAF